MTWRPVSVALLLLFALSLVSPSRSVAGDEGEQVFLGNCTLCHTAERARAKHLTRGEWQQIINRMIGFGCPISTSRKNQEAVLEYLAKAQGPGATPATRAYVVNEESEDVWVIDVPSRRVLAKVKVGKLPHGIAVSPTGKRSM